MAAEKFPPDNEIGDPNQPTEGASKFIGGGGGHRDLVISPGKLKNYDSLGNPERNEKTAKEISAADKPETVKKENEKYSQMLDRRSNKTSEVIENKESVPQKGAAVSAIEKRMKELEQEPNLAKEEESKSKLKDKEIKPVK